jgi:hypothetical protein
MQHMQDRLRESVHDLRRTVGLNRIAWGLHCTISSGTVTLQPGVAFSASGVRLNIDAPANLNMPTGNGPWRVVLRAKESDRQSLRVGGQPTLINLVTTPSVETVDESEVGPDALVIANVSKAGDEFELEQNAALFVAAGHHSHSGEFIQDEFGHWHYDGPKLAGEMGPKGDPGPTGPTGATGAAGAAGEKGDRGEKGDPGPIGPQGIEGALGPQGAQGPAGSPGSAGAQGAQGQRGERGEPGEVGPVGPAGAKGDKGDKGDPGPKGDKGDAGSAGAKGDTGAQGAQGAQGAKGDKGDAGAAGPKGDRGEQGAVGPVGPTGPVGPAGAKGDKGDAGVAGPKGERGEPGVTGPKGDKGDTGLTGAKGDTGAQGVQGVQGAKGDKGDQGIPGPRGAQGPAGPGLDAEWPFIKEVSWPHGATLPSNEVMQALSKLSVVLSHKLLPQIIKSQPQVVQVWLELETSSQTGGNTTVPATQLVLHGSLKFDGQSLIWSATDNPETLKRILAAGGRLQIRVHCGYLITTDQRPVSAALDVVTGFGTLHVPGGIFESWFFVKR